MNDAICLKKANFSTNKETILYAVGYIEDQAVAWFREFKRNVYLGQEVWQIVGFI